ncbi:MAG: hypothetical protein ACM3O3_05285 [Syntrophothermus sp.]
MITTSTFIALEGNINDIKDAYYKNNEEYYDKLFNVIRKKQSQFTDMTLGAPGRMKKWAGSVTYDDIDKGYEKQYRVTKYEDGIQIDRDIVEYKEYERIKPIVNNKLFGVVKTMRYESADIFNEAFSTAKYTGPDGASLCSASHRTIPGAALQSNTGTLDLTYDNLETTRRLMRSWKDDRVDKMLVEGKMVIAGDYHEATCKKMFGSDKEAFTDDNNINIYKNFSYFIHPLIEDKKWFVVDPDMMKGGSGLNFFIARDPHDLERDGATATGDFNSEKLSWKIIGSWDKGWTNWFFIYGNNP